MPAAKPVYRHDLDGLRGLAIALVVVFHVWFGKVSGGVDIFLVLSGYFFAGSLIRKSSRPGASLNPLPVVRRTLRRLIPTLAVVLAAVAAATVAWKPRTQWEDIADELIASILYHVNWELAGKAADYAAADASISPLQHLWSMSVQGQFYLIAIAGILGITALWRVLFTEASPAPAIAVATAAGGTASFVYAIVAHDQAQAWNYYATGTRLWEIFVGVLLAIAAARVVLPVPLRQILGVIGLTMVVTCGIVLDGATLFPGPAAWFPVGAAVLLILAGNHRPDEVPGFRNQAVSWILSTRPLRELGNLAYALYVWHWPILIFAIVIYDLDGLGDITFAGGAAIIGLSLVLAWLTRHLLEEPLRESHTVPAAPSAATIHAATDAAGLPTGTGDAAAEVRDVVGPDAEGPAEDPDSAAPSGTTRWASAGKVLAAVSVVAMVAGTASWALWWRAQIADRESGPTGGLTLEVVDYPGARSLTEGLPSPDVPMMPEVLDAKREFPVTTWDGCISNFQTDDSVVCVYGDVDADRTIALVGGSHSEHWITALDVVARERGYRIVTFLKMGCVLTNYGQSLQSTGTNYAGCRPWGDQVIRQLVALRPDFVFTTATRPAPHGEDGDILPPEYLDTWAFLTDHGMRVVAVRDTPWLAQRAPDCLEAGDTPEDCGKPRRRPLAPVNPATAATFAMPGVILLDLSDAICDVDVCRVAQGNVLVYHDAHHISSSYSLTLAAELDRQMGLATNEW